jgi:hypothetical protein
MNLFSGDFCSGMMVTTLLFFGGFRLWKWLEKRKRQQFIASLPTVADQRRKARDNDLLNIREESFEYQDGERARWRRCVHETGHVIIELLHDPENFVLVTVIPHHANGERTGGGMRSLQEREVSTDIRVAFAGILAEEIVLGDGDCHAAHVDLSDVAKGVWFLMEHGDSEFSLQAHPIPHLFEALGVIGDEGLAIAELQRLALVARQIREETHQLLLRERTALMAIAEALQEHNTLDYEAVLPLWEQHRTRAQ